MKKHTISSIGLFLVLAFLVGCQNEIRPSKEAAKNENTTMASAPKNLLRYSPTFASAGQPNEAYLQQLADQGVDIVINIAPHSARGALDDEQQAVTITGMQYLYIPVIWDEPTQADVETYLAFMQEHRDKNIFLHCQLNMRATAFAFLHRVINLQVEPSEALDDMLTIWTPNKTWQKLINTALTNHDITYQLPASMK